MGNNNSTPTAANPSEAEAKQSAATTNSTETEIDDPVELMIKETGCLEYHNKVQNCITEHFDWRKCQKEVENFRICIEEHQKKKNIKN